MSWAAPSGCGPRGPSSVGSTAPLRSVPLPCPHPKPVPCILPQSHAGVTSRPWHPRRAGGSPPSGVTVDEVLSRQGKQMTDRLPPVFLSFWAKAKFWLTSAFNPRHKKRQEQVLYCSAPGQKTGLVVAVPSSPWAGGAPCAPSGHIEHRIPREPAWPGLRHPGRVPGDPFPQRSTCSRLSGRTRGGLRSPQTEGL